MSLGKAPAALGVAVARPRTWAAISCIVALFKVRVVALLLFEAVAAAFVGAGGTPPAGTLAMLIVAGGMAAAGAAALNEYLERADDARMLRTRHRPLVVGALRRPELVPAAGVALVITPVAVLAPAHGALAVFLALGALIYVAVYTIWLKHRTPLNIVVGGLAGSCAALAGGAAVGGWSRPGVLGLALLVFLWTPVHFWSLSMVHRSDYARAGIPMLPTVASARQSAAWILAHAVATGLVALALGWFVALPIAYLPPAATATLALLGCSVRLLARPDAGTAGLLFKASNLYLASVLLAASVGSAGFQFTSG